MSRESARLVGPAAPRTEAAVRVAAAVLNEARASLGRGFTPLDSALLAESHQRGTTLPALTDRASLLPPCIDDYEGSAAGR